MFYAQEIEIARHEHQADAVPVQRGHCGRLETASGGRAAFSVSLHRARRGSGDGVQATVRRVEDQGRVAAFVSVCVGGAGVEMRFPGAVCAAGVGTQLQGGASRLCQTRPDENSVAGRL